MYNVDFQSSGMEIIDVVLDFVVPDQTVDLWYIAMFWSYGTTVGLSLPLAINFAIIVYDLQMDLYNPGAASMAVNYKIYK